jgi:hypothetical protein
MVQEGRRSGTIMREEELENCVGCWGVINGDEKSKNGAREHAATQRYVCAFSNTNSIYILSWQEIQSRFFKDREETMLGSVK